MSNFRQISIPSYNLTYKMNQKVSTKMQLMKDKDENENQIFYRPAQTVKECFSERFDYRFTQILESIVNKGFIATLCAFIRWRTQFVNLSIPNNVNELERQLPINFNPNFDCPENKIKYTWIGHSTAVISIGGKTNILIDPVFLDRVSPFQCIGPKRFRKPACEIKDLPKIDMVLVSHDHYDHLEQYSLNQLEKLHKPTFVAGLSSKDVFPKNCQVHELDWTKTKSIRLQNGQVYEITFVPACHWSKRWLFDTGKRLWGGFVIKTPKGHKIFYSGDTGYCSVFKQIGKQFKSFDLCILPIGAYQPREILKNQHVNPEQAVIIHKQLNSKKSVGVHWGTFPLGWQHWHAARDDLSKAVQKHQLTKDQFITVGHGNSFYIDYEQKK